MFLSTNDQFLYCDGKPIKGDELAKEIKKKKLITKAENEIRGGESKKDRLLKTKEQKQIEELKAALEKEEKGNAEFKAEINKKFEAMEGKKK